MGSCISSQKGSTRKSAIKRRVSFRSQNEKLQAVTESSFRDRASTFKSNGSKEETFLDSQPWLESDCEDDFLSVKDDFADFTPSCGNTPVHSSMKTPSRQETTTPLMPEPSPISKRLSQLLQDSRGDNQCGGDVKVEPKAMVLGLPESNQDCPCASGAASFCSSERVANEDA